ncbi:MAG TPA: DUF4214 domain-containing protein [Iamia sp.]
MGRRGGRAAVACVVTMGLAMAGLTPTAAGAESPADRVGPTVAPTEVTEPAPDPRPIAPSNVDLDAPPTVRRGSTAGPSDDVLARSARSRTPTDVVVEIRHDGDQAAVGALVRRVGGRVHGPAGDHALEATVLADAVTTIEDDAHVEAVTTPSIASSTAGDPGQAVTGQEVALLNADDWQAAGITGVGVKVGIIDAFDGGAWANSAAAGDLPANPTGTFCRDTGVSCNIWLGGTQHGVAVAEIIHEVAPSASLYIADVRTAADMQAAINYFDTVGVKVVTRSQTAEYDGPGNGTGPLADVVNSAISNGMVYLNSAGNSAGGGTFTGSYWRGSFADADADNWLDFAPGDELLATKCWFFNGVRWSDWGANKTDYDVYLFNSSIAQIGSSQADQTTGAVPIEKLNHIPCTANATVHIGIRLFSAGSGTAGDVLETMVNGVGIERWSNPGSAGGPMSDSANAGMLTVGAIDPPTGTTIAAYSSQGPTNDSRVKPDVSAVACVHSTAYAPNCFNGTSAATPVAAGAVALAIDADKGATPAALANYIRNNAIDRGAAGTDNVYGRGQVVLPVGSPAPFSTLTAMVNRQFLDFVGRSPTTNERSLWVQRLLLKTHTRADLVAFLRSSTENVTNVDPMTRLYRAYFLRIPDEAGLKYWIGRKRAGTSLNTISQSFATSNEFRVKYGNLTNQEFVETIYDNILGRPGEPDGVAYWTGQLNSGAKNRGQVMVGFSESGEYKTAQAKFVNVSVIVILMLDRAPTTGEMTTLTGGTATSAVLAEWCYTHGYAV